VTESVLLSDRLRTSRMLERLVDQGVRIAIDDFGVGYSSLGQLKTLPAKVLKIDRSFVSSMETDRSDEAIVSASGSSRRVSRGRPTSRVCARQAATSDRGTSSGARFRAIGSWPRLRRSGALGWRTRAPTSCRSVAPAEAPSGTLGGCPRGTRSIG
jgi:EAL domain